MSSNAPAVPHEDEDSRRLAEMGYAQEFDRRWSGFSNFAISFSIISILSGCFTTFGQAWYNGGPLAISIGWPVIAGFILIIGLCMSELLSAFPTAGGIYYWSFSLGKPIHGWLTGWLNLVGLIAVIAGVDYGFATFFVTTANLYSGSFDPTNLKLIFLVFVITAVVHVMINVFGARVISLLQNVNVYWHVFGVAAIVLILVFGPDSHQSANFVFTDRINNSGFSGAYWFYVLPLGFLLTQYTITGFDASAHVSEETGGAATTAARGLWRSIFYSAVGGWIMLLAFLFAATHVDEINKGGGAVTVIFLTSLNIALVKVILIISCVGQFLCGMSCVTAASRMLFAFSRDRAVPGHDYWTRLDRNRNPSHAAVGVAAGAVILTLPALYSPKGTTVPVAFFAVTSITVLGLFLAFAIPIWLRWRAGSSFVPGPWTTRGHWRWMCPVAVAEIIVISIYFILPTTPAGVPWDSKFDFTAVQYAPVALLVVIGGAMLWWVLTAKNWFTGPVRTAGKIEVDPLVREVEGS
jgi:amino acid transporter